MNWTRGRCWSGTGRMVGVIACALVGWTVSARAEGDKVLPELDVDAKAAAIIESLDDHTGAMLPPARIVGEFGPIAKALGLDRHGPQGRDFTIKMAWAPDRERAFFCGANHGAPHKLNDVWEYDLAANAWICQWDPDYNNRGGWDEKGNSKTTFNKDGIRVTEKGAPVARSHTWWGLTYDPVRRAMLWMSRPEYKDKDEGENKGWPALFAFRPYEAKWHLRKIPIDRGGFHVPGQALEYIPELHGAIWWANRGGRGNMYLLPSQTNTCVKLETKGDKGTYPSGYDAIMAYDSEHRVIATRGGRGSYQATFHFDVDSLTWTRIGVETNVPSAHDKRTLFGYDPVGRVCLMADLVSDTLWSYSVEDRTWKQLPVKGEAQPNWPNTAGYFDPARNVFVLVSRRKVWVYRNKRNG